MLQTLELLLNAVTFIVCGLSRSIFSFFLLRLLTFFLLLANQNEIQLKRLNNIQTIVRLGMVK